MDQLHWQECLDCQWDLNYDASVEHLYEILFVPLVQKTGQLDLWPFRYPPLSIDLHLCLLPGEAKRM